ncbi:hypothetical protein ACFU96_21270 [Streptomyces sp. NPDC057620]|uniref:hypothetical protein n=1 Tax=Streptomyces sp. NPDC057620 TaxID=3346185 RepID=UPI0036CE6278
MTQSTTRTYQVTNGTALFGARRIPPFRSSAPVGTVIPLKVYGRRVDVELTGDPLNGGLLSAELQFPHL